MPLSLLPQPHSSEAPSWIRMATVAVSTGTGPGRASTAVRGGKVIDTGRASWAVLLSPQQYTPSATALTALMQVPRGSPQNWSGPQAGEQAGPSATGASRTGPPSGAAASAGERWPLEQAASTVQRASHHRTSDQTPCRSGRSTK